MIPNLNITKYIHIYIYSKYRSKYFKSVVLGIKHALGINLSFYILSCFFIHGFRVLWKSYMAVPARS